MSSQLDIFGSVIIVGMVLLHVAFFFGDRAESRIHHPKSVDAQNSLTDVANTLRSDLLKIGHGCDSNAILRAEPDLLLIRADVDDDGTLDTVSYRYTTSEYMDEASHESRLYRSVSGKSDGTRAHVLSGFRFRYFTSNSFGVFTETDQLSEIRTIGVRMCAQGNTALDGGKHHATNEFTVSPPYLE